MRQKDGSETEGKCLQTNARARHAARVETWATMTRHEKRIKVDEMRLLHCVRSDTQLQDGERTHPRDDEGEKEGRKSLSRLRQYPKRVFQSSKFT